LPTCGALCYGLVMNWTAARFLVALLGCLALASPLPAQLPDDLRSDLGPDVPAFKVRPGFRVTRAIPLKAKGLRDARFMEFSGDGKVLFLSQHRDGSILAFRDPDADGMYQTVTTFIKDKRSAHGMCWHDNWLYFGQSAEGSVSRARDTNGDGVADDIEVVLPKGSIPQGGGHPFEGVFVTEDTIYVSASDPTNMTPDLPSDRKCIYAFDLNGKNKRVFCTGVRNNEKLRFRPGTKELYGFDNGSDNFGKLFGAKLAKDQPITDLNPPEELNLYVEGGFYGHPFLSGNRVPRQEFKDRPDLIELANKTIPPAWNLHAHWACLGFTFVTKDTFGEDVKGDIFVAAHGSWNSLKQVGAVVERVMFDKVTGKPCGSQTIVDCVDKTGRRWARPVDCVEAPDGSILFSTDDPQSGIFRISRSKDSTAATAR
jgi:glucose/arabinose dehydrogenase